MNRIFTKTLLSEIVAASLFCAPLALAAELNLSSTPLITAAAVAPNMMLLLDSSGSMSNIVPDSPYNADTYSYTCEDGLGNGSRIDIEIESNGDATVGGTAFGNGSAEACFDNGKLYNARLYANGGTSPSGYLDASYTGHYLNWYFDSETNGFADGKKTGTFTRMEITKKASINLLDELGDIRIGLAKYNGSDGARILENIDDLSTIKSNLTAAITGISNDGMTPLGESLADMGRYFTLGYPAASSLVIHPDADGNGTSVPTNGVFTNSLAYKSGVTAPSEVTQYWCQQNFVVAMTDGVPTNDSNVSSYLRDYDNGTGEILDDVALAMFDIDLRPDLKNGTKQIKNNVITHVIGFADADVVNSTLMVNAAANGGGTFTGAADSAGLVSAFRSASNSIFNKVGTLASVSFNTSQLTADSGLYTANFNTAGWRGSLQAYPLSGTGVVEAQAWNAATKLDEMDYTDRNIFTYNQNYSLGGDFTRTNLSTEQRDDLNAGPAGAADADVDLLINYLRGDRSNEGTGATNYRTRSSRLGDIVNSTAMYVGAPYLSWPDYGSNNMFGAADKDYSTFKTDNAARTPMVYVGANDGMLHGFNASLSGTNAGKEQFAYIPGSIASDAEQAGLHYLAEQNYAHQFYVDLTPTISDVYIGKKGFLTTRGWRTLLIGGLRAGGKGLFALDVSDPENFAAQDVLWEFSSADDPDLGYTYSKPTVAMMANGKWAVIVGNGYNSGDGKAKLFIIFIEEGLDGTWDTGDYIKIDTSDATSNGLSTPRVVDIDGDGVADRIYAGDLQGNMWAFDVTSDDPTKKNKEWEVAYLTSNANGAPPAPLFTATDSSGNAQPITSAPILSTNPNTSQGDPDLLVFFGTGKYLEATDVTTNRDEMSYYSVLDAGASSLTRSDLASRELVTNAGLRTISGSDWTSNSGWYLDLLDSSATPSAQGERVIAESLIRNNVLFFNTVIPSGDQCSSGGKGWLMSLDLGTGLAPTFGVFDANGDKSIDDGDIGYIGEVFDDGLPSAPAILGDVQYTVGSTGALEARDIHSGESSNGGRLSWFEHTRE
ncbi:MAG: type IV pilus assembly protein PilY1 [Psychromonas sp.]|jgi:type IV pilus assembly protein PilY1|uniref:pilus assembly protein n=1 Tax=Psychromonas sp. TaxID=1884585 RepID=UPI0039E4751A